MRLGLIEILFALYFSLNFLFTIKKKTLNIINFVVLCFDTKYIPYQKLNHINIYFYYQSYLVVTLSCSRC
jgi:hypothetical protein